MPDVTGWNRGRFPAMQYHEAQQWTCGTGDGREAQIRQVAVDMLKQRAP